MYKENRPGVGAPERPALRRVPRILHESSTWYHLRSADTNVSAIFVPIFKEVYHESNQTSVRQLQSSNFCKNRIRKSFTGPGKKEVEREAQRYLLDHKETITAEVTNRTFKDAEEAFLLAREAVLSPATVRTYKSAQKCLALYFPWLMNTNIHDLTTDHLQRIVDELVKKNMKPKSVRNYYGFITVILDYNRIRLAPPRLPQKERSTLNIPDEATVKRVVALAEGTELEVPVMLAAFGPLRRGEICALTMDDIDGNVIHVCKDMVLDSNREWVVKPPKTFSSDRYVTMPDRIIKLIEKQGYVTNYDPNAEETKRILKQFSAII